MKMTVWECAVKNAVVGNLSVATVVSTRDASSTTNAAVLKVLSV